jgi:hypothetical protein
MVFFQAALLAGYAYAHVTVRVLGVRRQAAIHLGLVLTPLLLLPVTQPKRRTTVTGPSRAVATRAPAHYPGCAVPRRLGDGPPRSGMVHPKHPSDGPRSLLSVRGLQYGQPCGTPGVSDFDRANLNLVYQSRLWSAGYVGFVLLLMARASVVWRHGAYADRLLALDVRQPDIAGSPSTPESASYISLWMRGRWVLLAFVPSSLMLGLTTYITTNVAPMPLLWVVPLGLYLLTFVLTFGRTVRVSHSLMSRLVQSSSVQWLLRLRWVH